MQKLSPYQSLDLYSSHEEAMITSRNVKGEKPNSTPELPFLPASRLFCSHGDRTSTINDEGKQGCENYFKLI